MYKFCRRAASLFGWAFVFGAFVAVVGGFLIFVNSGGMQDGEAPVFGIIAFGVFIHSFGAAGLWLVFRLLAFCVGRDANYDEATYGG